MLKKGTVLVLSSLILLSIIPGIALNDAFADKDDKPKFDLFVDAKKECPGEGTKKHPYCNIQLAEDNSLPDYKIKVKGGEYGAVIVDVDGLTFQKGSSPVVDCSGAGNGFEILSNGVTIKGFEITNCDNGIFVNGASDTFLKKNKIHDNNINGILMTSALASLVMDNHISSNPTGILLTSSDGNLISKNKLEKNDDTGIVLDLDSDENFIHANTIDGGTTGILIFDPASFGNFLEDNIAKNNEEWGFDINSGSVLEENKAVGNDAGGFIISGDTNTLVNNKAVDNLVGFMGEDSSNLVLAHNKAIENRGDGFVLSSNDDVVLVENKSEKNGGHGFIILDSSGIQLFDNDSVKNGMDGYNVAEETTLIALIDNTARKNSGDGFELVSFFDEDEEENVGIEDAILIKNKSEKNGGFGFLDEFFGEDNIYVDNKCKGNDAGSSNPVGLCES